MSNLEKDPQEVVCATDPSQGKFSAGLRNGVTREQCEDGVVEILEPREVPLGGPRAMTVHRSLPQRARSLIGAWCFVDSYGPDDVARTGGMKVARHPHTGLATVSWLFEGRIDHLDSAGNGATVRPGEVNLMNAGRGITHSEFSPAGTTTLHGLQLWYALPSAARFSDPGLESHRPETVHGQGYEAKVFLGSLFGQTSPVPTFIPLTGAEIRLEPHTELEVELPEDHEHGLVHVSGSLRLNGVTVPQEAIGFVPTGHKSVRISVGSEPGIALLLGGEPLNEQILMWWNFVGRSHEEISQWRERYMQEMGFADPGEARPSESPENPDGTDTPQFGRFPPNTPAPLPAPELPRTRLKLRG
ncbi:pirin family protein [Rothia uropygialis]|uniref:pirin family protein n=1 Tax=Kocuria sp. 36 TaxID=1415402 RepID=UPI00101C5346|nr:pirin family protein [Kocuria sp. 36]